MTSQRSALNYSAGSGAVSVQRVGRRMWQVLFVQLNHAYNSLGVESQAAQSWAQDTQSRYRTETTPAHSEIDLALRDMNLNRTLVRKRYGIDMGASRTVKRNGGQPEGCR
jgi:hypothetical protein